MKNPAWIVLDVDGVLIGVEESYDLAVKKTAEKLLEKLGDGDSISLETVRELRRKGRFGDDYSVTEGLILAGLSEDPEGLITKFPPGEDLDWLRGRVESFIDEDIIVSIFDQIYLGGSGSPSEDGLWRHEEPLVDTSLLDEVARKFNLGFVTGRSRMELELASRILDYQFSNAITRETFQKPDPRALSSLVGCTKGIYIGDTYNDKLLVENFNKKTSGKFEFVLIDETKSINQVLAELVTSSKQQEGLS